MRNIHWSSNVKKMGMACGIYQYYGTPSSHDSLWREKLISMDLSILGYKVETIPHKVGKGAFIDRELFARILIMNEFYQFLFEENVDWHLIISTKLLPDDSVILVIAREVLFVINLKYQRVTCHDDEDLQACDFTRKQYIKLVAPLGFKVDYIFVLNDWFRRKEYEDILEYIRSVSCEYVFNEFPSNWLGLPTKRG